MHVATPPAPCPPPTAHLALPFFDAAHRTLALGLLPWAAAQQVDETDDRAACRDWVRRLGPGRWLRYSVPAPPSRAWGRRRGAGGWLRYCVPAAHGGALPALDSRALVLLRETLAYHSPLADFACAMQGLGRGAIGGLCVGDAGLGQWGDHAGRQPRAAGALPARGGQRQADRRLCAERA